MTAHLPSQSAPATVRSVQVGRIAPLGPEAVASAFVKRPVSGAVTVARLGLAGDEQADLSVHGGPDKAVYGYPHAHYPAWLKEYPQHAALLVDGAFGENLTLEGCDEHSVCLGDIVQIGTSLLQVTQPRQPCFKFALRFNDAGMARAMTRNGRCGWYYRVIEGGVLAAGDSVLLVERPHAGWSIERMNRQIVQRRGSPAERAEFAQLAFNR